MFFLMYLKKIIKILFLLTKINLNNLEINNQILDMNIPNKTKNFCFDKAKNY